MVNVTNITAANIGTITDILTTANNLSGGVFFGGIYFVIYLLLYVMSFNRTQDIPVSLAGVSFVQFIIAVLMVLAGWLTVWFAVLPLLILSLTLFSMMRG